MITVVGSSNTDFVLKSRRFPSPGETILAHNFNIVAGGKGANQAVAIRKLGGEAAFIARVGDDSFGQQAALNFKRLGINTKYIAADEKMPSGFAFIIVREDGANMIVVAANANSRLSRGDIARAEGVIKRSNFLLLQLEIPKDTARYAIELAHKNNVRVILNPAPVRYKLGKDMLAKVWTIIPNEAEAEALTGIKIGGINAAKRAAEKLLELGPEYVILTLGERGAFIATCKWHRHIKPRKVKVVDTTAAGDAFCGALSFALDKGSGVKEAAEFANAAAALSVTKLGAQTSLPTRKEVEKFLGRINRA